jgi:cell division transport system ATP-binding protein
MDLIKIQNVSKTYKTGTVALYDIDLTIEKGEFVFIIGASGSGKSTLIKMLYREEKPTDGQILVGGLDVGKIRNRKVYKLRRKIGIVFQDYQLLPNSTAYENVAFALEVLGLHKSEIHAKVMKVLDLVGLKNSAKQYPSQLSGGEQQRVALARALVNNPSMIIADEPTGNLDPDTAWDIMNLLNEINARGTTVVMATHAKDIVNKMKKRVIQIEKGVSVRDDKQGTY